jgi:hypothetical protein
MWKLAVAVDLGTVMGLEAEAVVVALPEAEEVAVAVVIRARRAARR